MGSKYWLDKIGVNGKLATRHWCQRQPAVAPAPQRQRQRHLIRARPAAERRRARTGSQPGLPSLGGGLVALVLRFVLGELARRAVHIRALAALGAGSIALPVVACSLEGRRQRLWLGCPRKGAQLQQPGAAAAGPAQRHLSAQVLGEEPRGAGVQLQQPGWVHGGVGGCVGSRPTGAGTRCGA